MKDRPTALFKPPAPHLWLKCSAVVPPGGISGELHLQPAGTNQTYLLWVFHFYLIIIIIILIFNTTPRFTSDSVDRVGVFYMSEAPFVSDDDVWKRQKTKP